MKIGIAGTGGIGSNVAMNLVRSQIGPLKLIDFDQVEPSNLNRQFFFADQVGESKVEMLAENLKRINPHCILETVHTALDTSNMAAVLADCSIIVEGLDRSDLKKQLIEECAHNKELVVSANGIAGHSLENVCTRTFARCRIVGDFVTDCAQAPLFAHKVLAIASMMTEQIICHIRGEQ